MPTTKQQQTDPLELFAASFKRSKKGNLWTAVNGLSVTVFKSGDCYKWCIASELRTEYSPESYGTERDAIEELFDVFN